MRKKFTMLLASLFLFGLGVMNAEVTKYYKPGVRKATLASGDVVMFYNTTYDGNQDRTGFLIDGGSSLLLSKQKPQAAPLYSAKEGVWTVETAEDNSTYYKVNLKGINGYVGIGGVTNNTEVRDLFIHKWLEVSEGKESKKSEKADGTIIENNEITADDNLWLIANAATGISNTWNGNEASFATWETGHAYAIYTVVEAETAELEAYLATVKTAAVNELETLGKLSIANVASIINEVNSVALSNNDLETALNSVETLVVKAKKTINGKSVVFDNSHTDARAGLSITANASKNKAYGTASEGDETIWTIMSQEDGSFKLYNFVTNKYLSTPGSNDNSANLVDEASAASYNFIVTDANKAALVSGGQMLHQRNVWSPNYDLINWYDLNDPASIWALTEKEIKISREQYDLAAVAKLALPWGIQQAYGLVTDAANYISNYKSDAEGSYEALLDNISDSFFHSAYGDEPGDGSGVHYIQADLGTGVDEFYFYMAPRNEKNRPKDITVSGSNSLDGEFVEIAKVTTTLASSDSYFSTKLGTDGTSYRYIRLTVTSTNTNTTFFTLSELYFLPATADVTSLVGSYNAFATSSITQTAIVDAATALVNAESVLALANIKKEIAALLDANKDNHAAIPVLGQYTTEAYNALNTAYTAVGATQESLEAAVAAFKAAKNLPVFMISNGNVKDYAKDKSIYDDNDGTLNFKATDVYDKTMWWALDMTKTAVEKTEEVGIYNVGTGNGFWGASSIKVTETSENDGDGIPDDGLFLFYTTGNNTPIHFQSDYSEIVRYGSKEATSGSAAMFTYIGNTYDLNKLTDEKLAAISALQDLYDSKNFYNNAIMGTAIGEYVGDKAPVVAALKSLQDLLSVSLKDLANMSLEDLDLANATKMIDDAAKSMTKNLPVAGKYYRFRSALAGFPVIKAVYGDFDENGEPIVRWKTFDEGSMEFYWKAVETSTGGIALQNVKNSKYLVGNETKSGAWSMADASDGAEIDVTILGKNETTGKYEYGVIVTGWQMHVLNHQSGAGTDGGIVSYPGEANSPSAWYIEELELPSFFDITYHFTYEGKVKHSVTKQVGAGAEYSDPSTYWEKLPYGIKIVGEKPAGKAEGKAEFNIALEIEKALPFKAAADVASINTWYYVQMHANPATTSYIQDNEAGNVEWADRFVAEDEIDSHLWGFAGDVWTGIKVVNKATGKAIVSTKGDAAMGDAANATAFIPTNSQANGSWFCLKYPEDANYLNAQSGKVASYGANDNGSSFLLTEYKEGAVVEVSDIEYATLYLDYAAYIPEGVEVYVVEKAANGYATLKLVENDANAIPANTGVILKNAGKYTLKAAGAGSVANTSSLLKGSVADTYVEGDAYVLAEGSKGVGLYKAQLNKNEAGAAGETHFLNNAGKAYLPASAVADASAPMFSFDRGEGTTDIIDVEPAMENVVIYDLTGRRVEKMEKGIYIVNGRKVYVK